MILMFCLSKEHPELPRDEAVAIAQGLCKDYRVEKIMDDLLFIDLACESPEDGMRIYSEFSGRAAMTRKLSEYVCGFESTGCGKMDECASMIFEKIYEFYKINKNKNLKEIKFAVRCCDKKSGAGVERILGEAVLEKCSGNLPFNLSVDLSNPDIVVLFASRGGRFYAGLSYLKRSYTNTLERPHIHPITMKPKLCRALVNLACLKSGDCVLDMFCGTGGILIEAGLMGMNALGFDIDKKRVYECRHNLEYFGIDNSKIYEMDSLSENLPGFIRDENLKVDAIVTDPPYGRSSYTSERDIIKFYEKFIESSAMILYPGKYLIFSFPKDTFEIVKEYAGKFFSNEGEYDIYVHKSLTRKVLALKRK